jgi:hypothetical protein
MFSDALTVGRRWGWCECAFPQIDHDEGLKIPCYLRAPCYWRRSIGSFGSFGFKHWNHSRSALSHQLIGSDKTVIKGGLLTLAPPRGGPNEA